MASFVLRVFSRLPFPLLAPLGGPVLLEPLAAVMGSAYAAQACLLEACSAGSGSGAVGAAVDGGSGASGITGTAADGGSDACYLRSVLHHLGFALGVPEWQQDFEACCTRANNAAAGQAKMAAAVANAESDVVDAPAIASSARSGSLANGLPVAAVGESAMQPLASTSAAQADVPAAASSAIDADPLQALLQRISQPPSVPDSAPSIAHANATPAVAPGGPGPPSATASGGAADAAVDAGRCRAVVDAIRRQEFGLGLALGGEAAALQARQNERIGRALQRLSQELYSQDTHFVLELVQNADDNAYPAGVASALEFVLLPDRVVVANNEVGFSEANLRALCDVGRSTKTQVGGYIGELGSPRFTRRYCACFSVRHSS